ncbi:hypothetical protein [Cryobacterium sp. PH31-L1]|uniref:hypothetical protein n=1 Tax=Cryobacterium sp. PH31-L1 TaxID=3046199 RepID=UPI0024B95A33|nr:hypothetical protein [Cryobacterium sp. PH31-L1]MDJ0378502.1 hypothetical protein [Cryobacterium sp. PH31-L1]
MIDPVHADRSAKTVAGIRASCDDNSRIRGSRFRIPDDRSMPSYLGGFSDLIAFAIVFRARPNRRAISRWTIHHSNENAEPKPTLPP